MSNELQQRNAEILIKVSGLIELGYEDEFLNLVSKIEKRKEEAELPSGLKEIYDKIGNNPIVEPEVYTLSKEIATQEKSIIDLVLKYLSEEEMDNYSIEDISYFAGTVIRKVNSKKDVNGIFKQTPKTSTWQRPKPSHVKTYEKLLKEIEKIDKKDSEEFKRVSDEFDKFLFKASKVEEEGLTQWEKELVGEQTSEALRGYLNSFMGKR
jgi:hypothetical protein